MTECTNELERGSGHHDLWCVEARTMTGDPERWNDDLILDGRWRRIPWFSAPHDGGIPMPRSWVVEIPRGYFTLAGARAAQWMILAMSEHRSLIGCVVTRLVHVEMTYSFAIKELGVEDDILEPSAAHPHNFKSVPR